jgi:hypothetical protein
MNMRDQGLSWGMRVVLLMGAVLLSISVSLRATVLEGRALEKGTKAFLSGASVLLESADGAVTLTADADAKGNFRFADVPEGIYRLTVAQPGFGKVVRDNVMVPTKGSVRVYLVRDGFTLPEVVVTARRIPKTAVSRQVVTEEELRRVPGTAGDPLRALQSLPGVATAGDFSGQLLVRGGGPNDNSYSLDRIPLAFPFHFGGLISTLNADLIKDVDFSAGGFNADRGNCWGGIIDVTQRDVRRDRWGGSADINMLMSDVLFEGPTSSNTALSISGRRSYLELLKGFFSDFTAIPSFGDYQAKFDIHASEKTQINIQAFGSDDQLGVTIKADSEEAQKDPALAGEFTFHNAYHSQGANLKQWLGDHDTLLWTPFHYRFMFDTTLGRDYFMNFNLESFGNRLDWLHDFGPLAQLRTGVEFERQSVGVDAYFARRPSSENDPSFTFTDAEKVSDETKVSYDLFAGYSEMHFPIGSKFQASAGLRYDLITYNDRASLSPRLSAAYDLAKNTTLKASWGIYRQMPSGDELDPQFGNKDLVSARAKSSVLGIERQFEARRSLRVEAYDKELDWIPEPDPVTHYDSDGVGVARGVEVFARQAPTARLFGWVSYAYSVSKRRDGSGQDWNYYDYDQRHIATVVASYKLTQKWETGFKWHLASGEPETPIVGAVYDPVHNYYIPISGPVNSVRKPAYHRLDLSFSRTSSHNTWQLRWYLEILNIYNSKNVIGYDYSADYTTRKEIKQIPFLPYSGVEVKF